MNPSIFVVLLGTLFFCGCSSEKNETGTQSTRSQMIVHNGGWPIGESRNWSVSISAPTEESQSGLLTISGEVDLPNPGYSLEWKNGPMDRRSPPGLRLNLVATQPTGMTAQVITPREVKFEMATNITHFREIVILSGDAPLVTFSEIQTGN